MARKNARQRREKARIKRIHAAQKRKRRGYVDYSKIDQMDHAQLNELAGRVAAKWKQRGEVIRKRIKETPFTDIPYYHASKRDYAVLYGPYAPRVSNLDHLKEVNIDRIDAVYDEARYYDGRKRARMLRRARRMEKAAAHIEAEYYSRQERSRMNSEPESIEEHFKLYEHAGSADVWEFRRKGFLGEMDMPDSVLKDEIKDRLRGIMNSYDWQNSREFKRNDEYVKERLELIAPDLAEDWNMLSYEQKWNVMNRSSINDLLRDYTISDLDTHEMVFNDYVYGRARDMLETRLTTLINGNYD